MTRQVIAGATDQTIGFRAYQADGTPIQLAHNSSGMAVFYRIDANGRRGTRVALTPLVARTAAGVHTDRSVTNMGSSEYHEVDLPDVCFATAGTRVVVEVESTALVSGTITTVEPIEVIADTLNSIAVALAGSAPVEPTGVSLRDQITEIHEAIYPDPPTDSPLVITPSEVGKVTGFAVCYGLDGAAAAGIVVTYKLQSPPPRDAGRILNGSTTGTRTSAANGLITFPGLFPGATYYFTCGSTQVSVTIPLDADPEAGFELPSFTKT